MSAPGFTCAGFSIHLATFSGVFFMMPAAIVVRLPKCVRFGPSTPADRPSMVWQPMQADWLNTSLPLTARSSFGSTGGACCAATHLSQPALSCTNTRKRMLACDMPQYSAHWPRYSPGPRG
jgi:hypothetical protein